MMKHLLATVACAAVFAFTGCDKGTPGGAGATNPSKGTQLGQKEESFSLSPPTLATRLKQGETREATIGIKRGKNFDEDVTIRFENLPNGITLDPASSVIKHGDKETKVMIKAADDAAIGDHTITMKGHAKEGPEATNELKITVSKK